MTGWRIGMAVGNKDAIRALGTIKTNIDSGIFKAIQEAGIAALTTPTHQIETNNRVYMERRDALTKGLNSLGWDLPPIKATFYVWAPVPPSFDSVSFCSKLLDDCGIVVVPGSGYGPEGEGYFRIALTKSVERINEAIERLKTKGILFHS
jgi:LL-diaminopimelate aminotransferase